MIFPRGRHRRACAIAPFPPEEKRLRKACRNRASRSFSMRKSGRERSENARPAARAFVEGGELVLLIRRMDAIVFEPEADHQRIHFEIALENADDRDRATGADQHRLLAPFRLKGAARAA